MEPLGAGPREAQAGAPPELLRFAEQRRRGGEIRLRAVQLEAFLNASAAQDEMTRELRGWQQRFMQGLNINRDAERVQTEFAATLRHLLTEPIYQTPFEEDAVLGSDGRTYGSKALCVRLKELPPPLNQRSPMEPQNPALFSTEAHPVARHFVAWLNQRGSPLLPGQEQAIQRVNQAFEHLAQEERVPPTRFAARRRQVQELNAQREGAAQQREAQFDQMLNQARQGAENNIQNAFQDVQQEVDRQAGVHAQQLNGIEQRDQGQEQAIQAEIDHLNAEIQDLEQENQNLAAQMQDQQVAFQDIDRENAQLKTLINQTEIAIKERKKREWQSLAIAVGTIAVCCIATAAMAGGASSAASASVKFVPYQKDTFQGISAVVTK